MSAFPRHYRIVSDRWSGFEVQVWRWWWPFWVMPTCNTHRSVERAEAFARQLAESGGAVKDLGVLP